MSSFTSTCSLSCQRTCGFVSAVCFLPANRFLSVTGKYFWRLTREKHLVSLRPAQIHRFWRGLPPNLDGVDAVYERPGDHKIVFFKGEGRPSASCPRGPTW